MKILPLVILLALISCKQNKKHTNTGGSPKIVFDGSKLVDKNRNDSIICNLQKEAPLPKNYNYNDTFDLKTFLMKNQDGLQIKEIQHFENKNEITTCNCGFDKILENKKTNVFLISFKNIPTKVGVVEYSFNNEKDLLDTYTMFYNYTEFTRNLSRDKYEFRCCDPWEFQIYYTTIKGNKLFFIDDSSNLSFDNKNMNIQKQIRKDKNIKMDDIYEILK